MLYVNFNVIWKELIKLAEYYNSNYVKLKDVLNSVKLNEPT